MYVTGLPKIEYVECNDDVESVTETQVNNKVDEWMNSHPDWWTQEKRRINKERKLFLKDMKRLNLR
jgi:hypothetical protein